MLKILLLLSVLAGLHATTIVGDDMGQCSQLQEDYVYPCKCENIKNRQQLNITCDETCKFSASSEHMNWVRTSRYKVWSLYITDKRIVSLSENFFGRRRFHELCLVMKSLNEVNTEMFSHDQLQSLRIFTLRWAQLRRFPIEVFQYVVRLDVISFEYCYYITTIENDYFTRIRNAKSISVVRFTHGGLNSIGDMAFAGLTGIVIIDLSWNNLVTVSSTSFFITRSTITSFWNSYYFFRYNLQANTHLKIFLK